MTDWQKRPESKRYTFGAAEFIAQMAAADRFRGAISSVQPGEVIEISGARFEVVERVEPDELIVRRLPHLSAAHGAPYGTEAPAGWCPVCGGKDGEHKPGCEPAPGDIV